MYKPDSMQLIMHNEDSILKYRTCTSTTHSVSHWYLSHRVTIIKTNPMNATYEQYFHILIVFLFPFCCPPIPSVDTLALDDTFGAGA